MKPEPEWTNVFCPYCMRPRRARLDLVADQEPPRMLTCARCEPKQRAQASALFMRWLGYLVAFLVGLVAWGLFYLWELSR